MGRADDQSWCILRTSASRTLKLAKSLRDAGIEAWTPARVIKRPALGSAGRYVMGQRRVLVEVALPIMPGFVFAHAVRLADLFVISDAPFSPHPGFSLLRLADRVPLITEEQIAGLRDAEADALAAIMAVRDADDREAARKLRAEQLGTERARRKALRQERKELACGAQVNVEGVTALAGLVGEVIECRGASAVIHFGGSLTMTVEAWQVHPIGVFADSTSLRAAA
jgi:hypothetical protein